MSHPPREAEPGLPAEEKSRLRLFVVGALSPDPNKWSPYGRRAIVVASDSDEAERLASEFGDIGCSGVVTEIPMDSPLFLMMEDDSGEF
jgi:hypothetical protein